MYKPNIDNIDNKNDRCKLVLLDLKERKSWSERRMLSRLKNLYPDYMVTYDQISRYLLSKEMLVTTFTGGGRDKNGIPIEVDNPDSPPKTSELGIKALRSNLFPSEKADNAREKRFRLFEIIGISVAAVPGLVWIFDFIYKLIDDFIRYIMEF